jgi:O-succinylbenzoate synthase
MRQAQVYRWQIPMDAGVVLRERRLKTAMAVHSTCRRVNARAGAKFASAGL